MNTDLRTTVPTATGRIGMDERRARFARCMVMEARREFRSAAYLRDKFKGQKVLICGGGPSIENTLKDIKRQIKLSKRVKVLALNKTHDWLLSKGVQPDIGCMGDPAPHVATYQTYQRGTDYLLGSTLHDDTLARFAGKRNCYIWHPTNDDEGDKDWFDKNYPGAALCRVSGKSTVGLRSVTLAPIVMGFAEVELHGFDSCDAPRQVTRLGFPGARKLYPYSKPNMEMSFKDLTMCAKNGDEFHYEANEHMARQSYEFFDALAWILDAQADGRMPPFNLRVSGDGAIPWLCWKAGDNPLTKTPFHATPERMQAKYGDAVYYDYAQGMASKPADIPEVTVSFDDIAWAPKASEPHTLNFDAPAAVINFSQLGQLSAP